MDFTVAIRTYNRSAYLREILDRLREQVQTELIDWEIVIVNNNSTDNTFLVVQEYQAHWPYTYPIRYFLETQQGAFFARQRCIQEAKGELIGFLDDDNFPALNWVYAAYSFAKLYPKAVAYGSRILGKFEVEPPENFERIQSFLALKERGSEPNLYDPKNLSLPPGAGLVARRQTWLAQVPNQLTLQGPVGKSLAAKGEDFEALLYLSRMGEIWYNPEMLIEHIIPSERLKKDYLINLIRNVGLSICQLRMTNAKPVEKPKIVVSIFAGNLRRILLHLIKYKWAIQTDLVAACEMEFFLSSLLSPLYFAKNSLFVGFSNSGGDSPQNNNISEEDLY
jgi:glycosyltransferase involved in cell wall biosynthesis